MTAIIVQAPLTDQLQGLIGPVELIDEQGRHLGHFVPRSTEIATDSCPYSFEELARMRAEQGGRSLADIWRSLGVR